MNREDKVLTFTLCRPSNGKRTEDPNKLTFTIIFFPHRIVEKSEMASVASPNDGYVFEYNGTTSNPLETTTLKFSRCFFKKVAIKEKSR